MTSQILKTAPAAHLLLRKSDPALPALIVTGRRSAAIRAGTKLGVRSFAEQTELELPALEAGADYAVLASLAVVKLRTAPVEEDIFAGFHFAPGGNAPARSGGDSEPAINPFSAWDLHFRPAAPDPRGMFVITVNGGLVWIDIYKLGRDHLKGGTSQLGVTIADGDDPPQNPAGGRFEHLNYETALAVMKHHGKGLLNYDEFRIAAFGVTEKSAHRGDPKITELDAPRTSQRGMIQATGSLWEWGHDGDPDKPRASIFGGSWLYVDSAGSRFAYLGHWPDFSFDFLGARGRCDHLQLD